MNEGKARSLFWEGERSAIAVWGKERKRDRCLVKERGAIAVFGKGEASERFRDRISNR